VLGDGAVVVVGYLLGTFPTAALVGRRAGVDPTASGSGNPGATNVYRTTGRRAGAVVLAVDAAKGGLAAGLGWAVGGHTVGLLAGAAAVVGHIVPVTRGFKGGKGVATGAGMAVVLYPLLGLVLGAAFAITFTITRRVSIGSLTLAVLFPVGVALAGYGATEALVAAGVSVLVIARHHDNIRRLIRREEAALAPPPEGGRPTP